MPYDFNNCAASFNDGAADGETDFQSYLTAFFDRDTTRAVMKVFEKLGRSAPEYDEEFVNGTDGPLLLLSRFGLVLRIENAETKQGTRIDDSAWVAPALASIRAGKALIELVPGGFPDEKESTLDFLNHALDVEAVYFHDRKKSNAIRQAVKTPSFPDGAPAVGDRLAVVRMSGTLAAPDEALAEMAAEILEARRKLYAPLQEAFAAGWQDSSKMPAFWEMAEQYLQEGKLAAGWNDDSLQETKSNWAARTAYNYAERAQLVEDGITFCPTVRRRIYDRAALKGDEGMMLM